MQDTDCFTDPECFQEYSIESPSCLNCIYMKAVPIKNKGDFYDSLMYLCSFGKFETDSESICKYHCIG